MIPRSSHQNTIRGALKYLDLQADLVHETKIGAFCEKQWASIQVLMC